MTENGQKFEVEKTNPQNIPVTQEPKKEISKLDFQEQITHLIPTAGTIELSKSQRDILYDPVKDEDVEIRPDGLIYLPWMEYVSRLKDAFGIGWAIIPQGMPTAKGDYVLWPFWLVIQGKIAGFAVGEQQYYANNPTMTYGDALEGAKSNALMRLCKGIGISLELWRPSFVRKWKEKYAESFPAVWADGKPKLKDGKQKVEWKKRGSPKNEDIDEISPQEESAKDKQTRSAKGIPKEFSFLDSMEKAREKLGDELYFNILKVKWGYEIANLVKDEKQQLEIYEDMKKAFKEKKHA